LQQTVQAVVAAVTASTKVNEPPAMRVSQVANSCMVVEQQRVCRLRILFLLPNNQLFRVRRLRVLRKLGHKGRIMSSRVLLRRRRRIKRAVFVVSNLDIILMTVQRPIVISVSPFIIQPHLVIF
jgi:hypothetical protein